MPVCFSVYRILIYTIDGFIYLTIFHIIHTPVQFKKSVIVKVYPSVLHIPVMIPIISRKHSFSQSGITEINRSVNGIDIPPATVIQK